MSVTTATEGRSFERSGTILTVGYMVSRGLAKAGSRQPYDERS